MAVNLHLLAQGVGAGSSPLGQKPSRHSTAVWRMSPFTFSFLFITQLGSRVDATYYWWRNKPKSQVNHCSIGLSSSHFCSRKAHRVCRTQGLPWLCVALRVTGSLDRCGHQPAVIGLALSVQWSKTRAVELPPSVLAQLIPRLSRCEALGK